jgi:(R)-2-hydroxyacyl-CoA dehydratese activating ATPase
VKCGGIDIGSRFIKFVLLKGDCLVSFQKRETGHNPLSVCRELLDIHKPDTLVATGYGRYLLEVHGNTKTITEIKAVAKGVKAVLPSARTIIDIGGQDTKVISLDDEGTVTNFEMNDRCAAGTGRFLEIMAKALGYELELFGVSCSDTNDPVKINSLCTVFAESEVVSLIAKGKKREVIAQAIHESIALKVVSLVRRIDVKDDLVFTGGCAQNPCLKRIIEDRLHRDIYIHGNPFLHAAYGAALYARQYSLKSSELLPAASDKAADL